MKKTKLDHLFSTQGLRFDLLAVKLVSFIILPGQSYGQSQAAYVAGDVSAYKNLNLKQGSTPEIWEDGIRTGGVKGTYEWWYFDTHLDDGSTMVIIFFTKPFTQINKGLSPVAAVSIKKPDGTTIERIYYGEPEDFSASEEKCDVVIGKNTFRGDLQHYEIHFEDEDLNLDADIQRETESWRPQTGHFYYGDKGDYFAWVVPVPNGHAKVNYTYKGESVTAGGSCYHDHNWGNKNMADLMNHWYWSRAQIGPYTVIAAELIGEKDYNNSSVVVFNLSKDGKTVVDDGNNVRLLRSYGKIQAIGKKPISDELMFIYECEDEEYAYVYTLTKEKNIEETKILDKIGSMPKIQIMLIELFTGFDGAYYRMVGTANLKVYKNGSLVEEYTNTEAIWELMFFGKVIP